MPRSSHRWAALVLACGLDLTGVERAASGQLAPISAPAVAAAQTLHLEVLIRGASTHLVEPFTLLPDGRLMARQADLEDVGIRVPGYGDPRASVDLDALPHVHHRYDPARQTIDFALSDADRIARVYDAAAPRTGAPPPRTDWGAVLNYSLYGTSTDRLRSFPRFEGANATLDARAFGPLGTLDQTMIAGATLATRHEALRLDTTYSYTDVDHMVTGEVGDVIAGGLPWTRPFRFGGWQLRRSFDSRPDLVTQPLPNVTGSAAVPSTVDVFVNGIKTYSQSVTAGPYSITNLPVVSGNGTAHVLVTDANGQQTATALPFFTTPGLLARGMTDFSIGGGFARRDYASASSDYGTRPLGSATVRRGLTDRITVDGHAEGGDGLANGGLGVTTTLGALGTLSAALSGSHRSTADGGQAYFGYSLEVLGMTLSAASQRRLGTFSDVGSLTATAVDPRDSTAALRYAAGVYALDARPPRALDRVTIGVPLVVDPMSFSVSLIHLVEAGDTRSRIVSASLARTLPYDASLFATAYVDASRRNSAGLFVGLSVPLGGRVRANIGGTASAAGRYSDVNITKPLDGAQGDVGWRLRDIEGGDGVRTAGASYRSGYGIMTADLSQQDRQVSGRGALDGSIGYVANAGFFAGGRATDGFAVVDVGAPDVPVIQDNKVVGTTNPWGKLLISDLRPYGDNQIAIDPSRLPPNAEAASTRQTVSPSAHGGIGLGFGVDRAVDAATVTFVTADGRPIQAGSRGHRDGEAQNPSDSFVLGYDGTAYVRHLKADNVMLIDLGDADCRAEFAYQPNRTKRPAIGPVLCR